MVQIRKGDDAAGKRPPIFVSHQDCAKLRLISKHSKARVLCAKTAVPKAAHKNPETWRGGGGGGGP